MQLHKYRWSRTYESAEEELTDIFESENITANREHHDDQEEIPNLHASEDLHIWCVEGSLTVSAQSTHVSLQPGDALDIPANTSYSILSGYSGCAYYTSLPK